MGRTRILLADDHIMICAGLTKLLEPRLRGGRQRRRRPCTAKGGRGAKPDVVLLDIGMPLLNGRTRRRVEETNTTHQADFPDHGN